MSRDIEYEKQNIGYCDFNKKFGIKCKNYKLCKVILPEWWFNCKGCYLCTNCHMLFGTWGTQQYIGEGILDFQDNLQCPICLEIKLCVTDPRCNHKICIDCFEKSNYKKGKCCLCRLL